MREEQPGRHLARQLRWLRQRRRSATYVLRGGGISLDPDERLAFARSPLDIQEYPCPGTDPVCQASYIRVYHPNATTWILRPHDAAQAVYRVWNSGAYLFEGYQTLPFEITVTKP